MSSRGVEVLDTTTVIIVTPPCSCHPGLLCLCCLFLLLRQYLAIVKMKNHFWRRFEAKLCGCEQKGAFCPILLLKPMRNSQSLQTTMSCRRVSKPLYLDAKASPFPSAQVPKASTRVFRLDGITCFHWSCEKVLPGNLLSCKLSINDDQCNGAPHVIYTSTYNPIKFQ